MKKQHRTRDVFEVVIEKLVFGGAGLARHEGKVVFVPFSVPGDRLLVEAVEKKKGFMRAEIVRVVEPGPGRVKPVCAHFRKCGGCHWQQLEYGRQVEAKRLILEEIFHHRFPQTHGLPIGMRASAQPFAYRSRARLQLRNSGTVGFYRCGSHSVEDVEFCPLFRPALNQALASLRQTARPSGAEHAEIDLASSEEEETWAALPAGTGALPEAESALLLKKAGGFTYAVAASVFFQANDFMVPELAALVQQLAGTAGNRLAFDLYSGVGLFSLPLAAQFAEVVAVENSAAAIRLCARNAAAAGLHNVRAVCADVARWLESDEARSCKPDLVLLDPPRTGAGAGTLDVIAELSPAKVIYVSCDAQTLVRDLAGIEPRGYRITFVEGLDMFPQTYHFETVVCLEKN